MLTEGYQPSASSDPPLPPSGGSAVRSAKPMAFRHNIAFVIQSDQCLTRGQAAYLREEWRLAWLASGASNPPGLLILEPGFEIYEMAAAARV